MDLQKILNLDPNAEVSIHDIPMVVDNCNETMVVIQENGNIIAEYRYADDVLPARQRVTLRRSIRRHYAAGGTVGNYQW